MVMLMQNGVLYVASATIIKRISLVGDGKEGDGLDGRIAAPLQTHLHSGLTGCDTTENGTTLFCIVLEGCLTECSSKSIQ